MEAAPVGGGYCLRTLCIPQVTARHGETESDFTTELAIVEEIAKVERSHAYVWMRNLDDRIETEWPGVTLFREEAVPNSFHALQTAVTGRLYEVFNRITGVYPVDMVLTSRAGLAPAVSVGLAANGGVPVLIAEPRVYAPGQVSHHLVTDIGTAARAVGYATSFSLFWSESERLAAREGVRMWMSAGAVDRFDRNSIVAPLHVSTPPKLSVRRAKRKRLIFAGRLNSNKRWDEVLDAFKKVMQQRTDTDVWLHSGTGWERSALFEDQPKWLHISERFHHRQDWYDLLDSANVGAYASDDEGQNLTVLELLARGVVMALPKRLWVDRLFPMEYPFKFAKMRDLPALLDWMLDNESEARAKLKPVRDFIADHHDGRLFRAGIEDAVSRVHALNNDLEQLYTFREDVDALLAEQQSVSMSYVVKNSRMGNDTRPHVRQVFNNYAGWLAVRDLDDHREAEPVFRRDNA